MNKTLKWVYDNVLGDNNYDGLILKNGFRNWIIHSSYIQNVFALRNNAKGFVFHLVTSIPSPLNRKPSIPTWAHAITKTLIAFSEQYNSEIHLTQLYDLDNADCWSTGFSIVASKNEEELLHQLFTDDNIISPENTEGSWTLFSAHLSTVDCGFVIRNANHLDDLQQISIEVIGEEQMVSYFKTHIENFFSGAYE